LRISKLIHARARLSDHERKEEDMKMRIEVASLFGELNDTVTQIIAIFRICAMRPARVSRESSMQLFVKDLLLRKCLSIAQLKPTYHSIYFGYLTAFKYFS
jgi:hypothetical protein